jgi:DNA-binding transcriptional MerR regulator
METDVNKGQYSIQLASKISGVGVHTIRAWEKRYQAVTPARNSSGRREYSDSDIERLTLLSELCTLGHTIGKIAGLPTQELKLLLQKLGKQAESIEARKADLQSAKSPVNVNDSLKSLLMALEMYKLDIISHEINKLKLVLTPRQLALDIIGPLLRKVGDQVLEGTFSISQEHALSAILKFHMGHMLFRGNHFKATKPHKILLCTPEGDYHEFGILQAALLCNHYQYSYYYLGPNLPVDSLLDAYESLEADTILIGSTVIPENKSIDFVNSYFEKAVKGIDKGKVLVGGNNHIDRIRLEKTKKGQFFNSLLDLDEFLKNY